jgi:hypothetical protein
VGAVDVPAAEGAHVKCDLADFLRTASVEDFLWNSLLTDFLEYIFNYSTQISRCVNFFIWPCEEAIIIGKYL